MDKELIKLLNWLYDRRHQWITLEQLLHADFPLTPHEIDWMLKNDILNKVTGDDGVTRYCISLGGRMKRAVFHRSRRIENLTLVLSFSALLVSIIALFVTVCLP